MNIPSDNMHLESVAFMQPALNAYYLTEFFFI